MGICNIVKNEEGFQEWQMKNKYFGKKVSIIGDSISTFEGYNPQGFAVFYNEEKQQQAGIVNVTDTWWQTVIDFFGAKLLVNNSWSGSRATKLPGNNELFPSGCSDERTNGLHLGVMKPDVILVYIGTNDWAYGVLTGGETRIIEGDIHELFYQAYHEMIDKLKKNYPQAEIFCFTLSTTFMSSNCKFSFPHKHGGTHIEVYNNIIKQIADNSGCRLIDLYDYSMPYDALDGSHPNQQGMATIAREVIRSIAGNDVSRFLDCDTDTHNYVVSEEYTGGTKFTCTKCCKVIHRDTLCDVPNTVSSEKQVKQDDSEYVLLDPEITTILYSDTLKFTSESTGETKEYHKTEVNVGRDPSNDYHLAGKTYVARRQATFLYERQMWFLRDNNSTNGTYINGKRLAPGKKYQLATNDEISFAKQETVVFDKHMRPEQPNGDPEAKAIVFLEAGMATFAKSQYKDDAALKLIVAALMDAPLYFPVEIDLSAMLGSIDPTKLKAGDTIEPQKDVRMRILTLCPEGGVETVPMFTSNEEANKGPGASMIRFYPQDYLPKLIEMDKPVIINPFSESRFLLSKQIITEILWPAVQRKVADNNSKQDSTAEKNSVSDNLVGSKIDGRYAVLKLLGQGGFFKTYLVVDEKCNKSWAMKVCDKNHRSYSPTLREVILQEPHMMMKLDHPAVPRVVDIVEDENRICIIREYIEGQTLDSVLQENGPIKQETVLTWAQQLCDVLRYLHKQNPPYIYRDMKPANVILQPCGNVKLVDFGAVTVYDALRNQDDCILGTKGYAAPEQYAGKSDPRSDIYGLGMTLHHLLTGVDPNMPPYETKPIRAINPNLSRDLEAIILRCTQLNPEDRFQNCDELLAALQGGSIYPPKKKGLFEKLFGGKSAKPKLNAKVEKIYEGMNKEYREKVFYGSVISANIILTTMTRNVFGTENDANIDMCFQIYLQTWIRSHGGLDPTFSTPSYIQQALRERFSSVDSALVSKCVTHALCEIYEREPELKKRICAIEAVQNNVRANAQKNMAIENLYLEDPEYGLVPGKPIFINGFGKDKEYFSHLYSENDEKLSFERVGSSEVPGIAGPIDLYRLILPNGNDYLRIFMCNYGSSYKKITPKGVKYID